MPGTATTGGPDPRPAGGDEPDPRPAAGDSPAGDSPERVWYAAYGSNCDAERLTAYLRGGALATTGIDHAGSADPTPPQADIAWTFNRALRFAGHSTGWRGAIALLEDGRGEALGRAWLVSWRQLEDVFAQENRAPHRPLTWADARRHTTVWDRPYGRVLHVGALDGQPVITFTAPRPDAHPAAAPSAAYLRTVVRGLLAVHRIDAAALVERLLAAAGVSDGWDRPALCQLVAEADARGGRV